MSYRYLGYGITDSNGEAKLEYDENGNHLDHSITGTGAGELDIVASLDNPIGSGSIVSEIYAVTDYNKLDTGIQGTASNIWSSTSYFDRQTDGTVFSNPSATGWTSVYFKPNNSQNIPLTDGLTFEFEILDIQVTQSDQFRVRFIDGGTNPYYSLTATGKYKFVLSDKLYGYKDGAPLGEGVTYDTSINTLNLGIIDTGASASVKFKNFGYY